VAVYKANFTCPLSFGEVRGARGASGRAELFTLGVLCGKVKKIGLLGRTNGLWEDNISMDDVMDWVNMILAAFC
jgi:hypothetical protein